MIYIGNDVRERMEMLGLSVADVADRTFWRRMQFLQF